LLQEVSGKILADFLESRQGEILHKTLKRVQGDEQLKAAIKNHVL
jgi:hypothetical protein